MNQLATFVAPFFVTSVCTTAAFAQDILREHLGEGPHASLGGAVAAIGDLDQDGVPDYALSREGLGSLPNTVEVFSGATGAVLLSISAGSSSFGQSIAGVGDCDGDGRPDLAVGEPFAWGVYPQFENGRVYVYSGASGALIFSVTGAAQSDLLGMRVAAAGDVNQDGHADVLAGASQWLSSGNGYALVLSGVDGSVLRFFAGAASGDEFGWAVKSLGDIDFDGTSDLIVGARQTYTGNGAAYVYSGASGALLLTLDGGPFAKGFGGSVAAAGDVDRDGTPDAIVGAIGYDPSGARPGAAMVFSGADGHRIHLLVGEWTYGWFGTHVAGAGDVDGDGYDDVAIGALRDGTAGREAGIVSVYSGRSGRRISAFHGRDYENLGGPIENLGDADQDGRADLILGSSQALFYPQGFPGRALVVSTTHGPAAFCRAVDNSSGHAADLESFGSINVSRNDLVLYVDGAPPNQVGLFAYGTSAARLLFGDGLRCIGGSLFRLGPPVAVGAAGAAQRAVDLTVHPAGQGPGAIAPGTTWYLQFFFHDPLLAAGAGSNTSNALRATFGL